MDSLGDWAWPGTRPAAEIMPPSWIPALPPRLAPVGAGAAAVALPQRRRPWRLAFGVIASALAALAAGVAIEGPARLERLVGYRSAVPVAPAEVAQGAVPRLPALVPQSSDAAGSSIDSAKYHSPALGRDGLFYAYLPPGFGATTRRYPVIYLLPGNSQPAEAFLQIGIQGALDELIAKHQIEPVIAIMIHGGPGANNWRNQGRVGYESYVLEVQRLVDQMLPTIPARGGRALVGDSMGGYGAMNIALGNPYRYSVVESWIGFFNGLEGELRSDRAVIRKLGLRAYVYGAEGDKIADPSEDAPWAAALRANGATAHSALYPGEHSLQTVEAHLASMLRYAARALASQTAAPHAAGPTAPAAGPRTRH
jgi:S-formylglutathione hydrolase FrmB